MLNVNARSIANKADKLESIILGYKPHVVVITESWLRAEIDDHDVFPPSYQVFRRDRPTRGGGVAVLVKSNMPAELVRQIDDHESIVLKLSCWERSLLLCAVYRAPDSPAKFLSDLHDHINTFNRNSKIIIAGDFNLPSVNWNNPHPACGSPAQHLFDIMFSHDMLQIVTDPTRVDVTSSSVLDLIFISRSIEHYAASVDPGLSDHKMVFFSCNLGTMRPSPVSKKECVKDFSRARDESVLDYLDLCLSDFNGTNVTELWNRFKEICAHCLRTFIPNKVKKTAKLTPWVTRDVIHLKRKVKRMRRRRAPREAVQMAQTALNETLKLAKRRYFQKTLPNFIRNAPQKFWGFLREKKKVINQIKRGDVLLTDKQDIADHFNEYFHSVFSNVPNSVHRPITSLSSSPESDFISPHGVLSMLLNLKTKSSAGPDGIPNVFLHRYAEMISQFLVIIFRASVASATLPPDWLTARVVPLFKKGDVALVPNYRPVSITSSCCKLLEHIIATYITNFLNINGLLHPCQHGFRKGLSTVTQLTTVIHNFATVLDKAGQVDAIFLDFSKAFDLVNHGKLIHKLELIGIPEFLINWVSSYLTNRTQFVSIDSITSTRLPVTSGVPQGSVLGPLLFLVYINDIASVVTDKVQIKMFADDCVLFSEITCKEDQEELNFNLRNIQSWCDKWDMKLNAEKTVFMRITNKRKSLSFTYTLPSRPLIEVNEYKYLGVTLTNTLSWNNHVSNICASAFRKLCLLRHKLKGAPSDTKLLAYTSIIRPRLEYACTVWDPHKKLNIQALERIQRKAIRFVTSKYRNSDSPTTLMTALGIQSLEKRRKILRLKFLFKLYNRQLSLDPEPFLQPLVTRLTRHRHEKSLTPYNARTNLFKNSFFPRTITDWNSLPLSSLQSTHSLDLI